MGEAQMGRLFWICLAGAAGTATRYLVATWAGERLGAAFPYGTLIVNLTGCFVIAGLMHVAMMNAWPATLRLALTVGFLGGFTTYSSFNYETARLIEEGAPGTATVNVMLTLVGGFAAGWLGLLVCRQLTGR
jgi:fluoride exporter